MEFDLLITNGNVVTEVDIEHLQIGVNGEKISALIKANGNLPYAKKTIDARGLFILPGAIEPHCHFWEPGEDYREGWLNGTQAAAAGGITTVIEMPLSIPPTVNREGFLIKKAIAEKKSSVDYAIWGGVIPDSETNLEDNLSDLEHLGAAGYKIFMCWAAQKYPPIEDGLLYKTMKALAKKDLLIGIHAENESLIRAAEMELKAAGRIDPTAFAESRPPEAEVEAITRALTLGKAAGVRLHIVHMGLADGADVIRQAKLNGQKVTVETAPQYLNLDINDLFRKGPYAKCAPPLRSRENVERLWEHVLAGTIDFIGADHAPFTKEEKEASSIFWDVPNGIPGMQESLVLMISEGYNKRGLPINRVAEMISTNVARTFRLYPQKGTIRIGSDADFAIVDLDEEWEINEEWLLYACKWSPYVGKRVKGKVIRTIVRGEEVYAEGEIRVNPGVGQFVKPIVK